MNAPASTAASGRAALSPRLLALRVTPRELHLALTPRATAPSAGAPAAVSRPHPAIVSDAAAVQLLLENNPGLGDFLVRSGATVLRPVYNALVQVTPEIAAHWLTANEHNRQPSETKILRFAAAMSAGKWTLTGEPVKFDTEGRLLDGQSRLKAVLRAGVPVTLEIRWGLPRCARESMDTGEARSHEHQLQMLGVKVQHSSALACALRVVWAWERSGVLQPSVGSGRREQITNTTIRETLERHPGLRDHVALMRADARVPRLMRVAYAGALSYLFARVDEKAAVAFFVDLLGTDPLPPGRQVIGACRDRLAAARRKEIVMGSREFLALPVKAWNAVRAGDLSPTLSFDARGNEPFPQIAGLERPAP